MRRIVTGIIAGTLLAAGAALVAPAAWQVLVTGPEATRAQQAAADRLLQQYAGEHPLAGVLPRSRQSGAGSGAHLRIPVADEPRDLAADLAVITVPRFGASWRRVVRQGIDPDAVLDSFTAGVGHYPGTAMPGAVGNFAIAGHDTGWGDAFRDLRQLRLGDRIEVRTALGRYTYVFRDFESVRPSAVEVLAPVPGRPTATAHDRVITLTTCDPPYDAQERFIAYGVLQRFEPAAAH